MRRRTVLITCFSAAIVVALTGSACTSILGDFEVANTANEAGASGKSNGEVCGANGDCSSGFCADGVCCESACSGTCESCALAEKGKCLPIPDGQDPDKECLPTPRPDAGTISDDAGILDDAGADASVDSGNIDLPDGGLVSEETKCAGSCDGNRKCKFPGKETTCGTQFCTTKKESNGLRCDGAGHCDLQTSDCVGFECDNTAGVCRTQCTKTNDCDFKHYCKDGACAARLPNGQECSLPDQCDSGFCVIDGAGGVCCNSDCGQLPGGNCKQPGSVGKCKCNVDCGAGACRRFYKDNDGDGHGDPNVGLAIVGCDNTAPPGGYSASNDDCNDNDSDAFPGQTAFFDHPTKTKGGYDFNCDGQETKETAEYPGGSCRFCDAPVDVLGKLTCPNSSTTACYRANQSATLTCKLSKTLCGLGGTCYVCDGQGGLLRGTGYDKGFTSTVACGSSATYTDCGACVAKGGAMPAPATSSVPQRCR